MRAVAACRRSRKILLPFPIRPSTYPALKARFHFLPVNLSLLTHYPFDDSGCFRIFNEPSFSAYVILLKASESFQIFAGKVSVGSSRAKYRAKPGVGEKICRLKEEKQVDKGEVEGSKGIERIYLRISSFLS